MAFGDIIQRKEDSNGADVSLVVTFDSTPVSGNLLVAVHMTGAGSSDSCSSASGSYTSAIHWQNATELDAVRLWYRIAGASEATDVTATPSASDENGLLLLEIEGPWEASPVDQTTNPGRQASSTTYDCGTTGTLSQADEVAVAAVYTRSASNGTGDSYSQSFVTNALSAITSSFKSISLATKLLSATTAVTTVCTFGTSAVAQGGLVTFKKAAAGGPSAGTDTATAGLTESLNTVSVTLSIQESG